MQATPGLTRWDSLTRMNVPDDLKYSSDHEWIRVEGSRIHVGITDYAQDALGDVVFVQVPEQGATVAAGAVGGASPSSHSTPSTRLRRSSASLPLKW